MPKKKEKIKYLTYDDLVRLNAKAKKENRNQSLDPIVFHNISKDKVFPVTFSMVHNDVEIRAMIRLNADDSARGLLDMSFEDFNSLPVRMV
tara:strand:+ start:1343 stop:1615 length:273 start_codon:yes stop_codon:yes gene_type:complete